MANSKANTPSSLHRSIRPLRVYPVHTLPVEVDHPDYDEDCPVCDRYLTLRATHLSPGFTVHGSFIGYRLDGYLYCSHCGYIPDGQLPIPSHGVGVRLDMGQGSEVRK